MRPRSAGDRNRRSPEERRDAARHGIGRGGLRSATINLRRSGGPPRPRLMTRLQSRDAEPTKSRTSRPRPSRSDCLPSEVVSRELGANLTQNRKERQRKREWLGDRRWIAEQGGIARPQCCRIGPAAIEADQVGEINVARFEVAAGRR